MQQRIQFSVKDIILCIHGFYLISITPGADLGFIKGGGGGGGGWLTQGTNLLGIEVCEACWN